MNILDNTPAPSNGGDEVTRPAPKWREVAAHELINAIDTKHPSARHGVVLTDGNGKPNDHQWHKGEKTYAEFVDNMAKGRTAYITPGAFRHDNVSRYRGRTKGNAESFRSVWLDIDAGPDKYKKNPDATYPDGGSALRAFGEFIRSTGLAPQYIVQTGSGGLHVYYVFDKPVSPDRWQVLANALVEKANEHGLKIDAQCTTDAARILRAPGSTRKETGKVVSVHGSGVQPHPYGHLYKMLGCSEPIAQDLPPKSGKYDLSVNADFKPRHSPYSYGQAAQHCSAMREAVKENGRTTTYAVWVPMLSTAKQSVEGRAFAHEASRAHKDYSEQETAAKLDSLDGGPASCTTWETAYGPGESNPCLSCEYRGKITNPAVQLGTVHTALAESDGAEVVTSNAPPWVEELNRRYAVLRHGCSVVVVDFHSPTMTARGVVFGFGFLDLSAFRALHAGKFAPIQKPGERQRPLAQAWLEHPDRRQYDGLVFAPGETVPGNILNPWCGFAVEPKQGEVSLWLTVLESLVPNLAERQYVLNWLAWKIQNPGGVPDTILIFTGPKGTGKNSLFDPIVLLFGRHAMVAADPELIVGRFTFHLMEMAFVVMDEAVFVRDPRQADRIKTRVTGKTQHYEQKGMDPIQGVNRCAYVMLTNHAHVWESTGGDERRAAVIETGDALRGNLVFWSQYHEWVKGDGPAHLLHYLQNVDLTGFNPRAIPKGEALRRQTELTALRSPAVAWWYQCLSEGTIRWRDNGVDRVATIKDNEPTEIDRAALRLSYEQSAGARGRGASDWASVSRRLAGWCAKAGGIRKVRARVGGNRPWVEVLPALQDLRRAFTDATHVQFDIDVSDD